VSNSQKREHFYVDGFFHILLFCGRKNITFDKELFLKEGFHGMKNVCLSGLWYPKIHQYIEKLPFDCALNWFNQIHIVGNVSSTTKYLFFSDTQPVTSVTPQTAVYEITHVTKADEGSYSCLACNAAGTTEERLHLTVEENEIIGGQFPGQGDIPGEYTYHFCSLYVLLVSQDEHICDLPARKRAR
jgi:hypothetical protein